MRRGARLALALFACLLLWAACGAAAFAAEAGAASRSEAPGTKRIALLPLIDRTRGWLTKADAARLTARLEEELYVPLNGTMHWVERLDARTAEEAFSAALSAQGKKPKFELAARGAAEALSADLVFLCVVDEFYERMFITWEGETYIEASVRLAVYGYDARHERLICAPASRFARDEYYPAYEASALAADALEEALARADVRAAIFPLSEREAGRRTEGDGNG